VRELLNMDFIHGYPRPVIKDLANELEQEEKEQ